MFFSIYAALNADSGNFSSAAPRDSEVSAPHPEKAFSPSAVTPSGTVSVKRLSHPSNADAPIPVSESGKDRLFALFHPEKA